MDTPSFHRNTAEKLTLLYATDEHAPDGWREAVAWHWGQAGAYREAAEMALAIAETRVSSLAFLEARHWTERALELLDQLDLAERHSYEMRVYALTISVLEFGGQYREALGYARLLLRLAEERGNVEAQGQSYLTIGRLQRELGNFSAAELEMQRAITMAERHQLIGLETDARLQLAKVHQLQGRHLEAFQQIELAQEAPTDDRARLARICTTIGDVYRVLGSGREALQLYHRALKLEIGSSNRIGQAMLYEKIGLSNLALGQTGEALQCAQEALRLRTDLNDIVGQARSQSILGMIQQRLGNYHQALSHFEQARDLEQLVQNRRGQSIALANLGNAARALGDHAQARTSYIEALSIAHDIGDQIGIARVHQRLGDLSFEEGSAEGARAHWSEALRIREALGHSEEAIALRGRISASQTTQAGN